MRKFWCKKLITAESKKIKAQVHAYRGKMDPLSAITGSVLAKKASDDLIFFISERVDLVSTNCLKRDQSAR